MFGLQPSQELEHRDTMDAVGRMSEAANHATNLLSAAEQPDDGATTSGAPKAMQTRMAGV